MNDYLKLKLDLEKSDVELAFEQYKNLIDSNNDRFVIIIHLIMIQNGFCFKEIDDSSTSFIIKHKHFSQLNYNTYKFGNEFEIKFETNVKIMINLILNTNQLTIQAFYKDFKSSNVFNVDKRRVESCLGLSCEQLRDFVIDFKNVVLNQLRVHLYETFNRSQLTGKSVVYLPNEIMLNIIKYLDIKTVINLSTSCKAFRNLIINQDLLRDTRYRTTVAQQEQPQAKSCNILWKYFLKRDFIKEYNKYEQDKENFYLTYRDAYRRKRGKRSYSQASSSSYDHDF